MSIPTLDEIESGLAKFSFACIKASRYVFRYTGDTDLDKMSEACIELRAAVETAEALIQRVKSGS